MMRQYYLAINGKQTGPFPADDVRQMIRNGQVNGQTLAFTQGMTEWTPISAIVEFAADLNPHAPPPPPPPMTPTVIPPNSGVNDGDPGTVAERSAKVQTRYGLQYEIVGAEMQFVEILLDPQQTIIAEAGSMMFMTQGIELDTILGDGSTPNQGLVGKLFEAGKRALTGATLFLTTFTNRQMQRETVAFSSPYPGKIVALDLSALGGTVICEKHSFLCAARGTAINVEFTRRIGAGFFGGEGFILQRLSGSSMAFIHACGTIVERTLRPGETLRVDTGCLVAFQPSVSYDIQFVGNIKTAIFGGEGLFFVTLSGPGKVWLQSLPFSRLADRIIANAPRAGGSRSESGSVLGAIGDMIGGEQD